MTQYAVADMMRAYAEDARGLAKQFDVDLDFSEDSLAQLDRILERYHSGIPTGIRKWFSKGPSEEQIGQLAKVWGGYLGETIIKHLGGEWAMSESFHDAIAVKLGGSEVYPPAKVYKRIINGSEDDVNVYFKVLKRDLAG